MADFEWTEDLRTYANEQLRWDVESLSKILQKISLSLHNIEGQAKKKRIESFVEAVEAELVDEECLILEKSSLDTNKNDN